LQMAHNFDCVISTSHPFSGHLVCLLAGVGDSRSHWLVDIGDPYSLQTDPALYNRSIYQWLSTWVERRVLEGADQVSVTTESTADLYRRHFRAVEGKISVIGPLLSLPEVPDVRPKADRVIRVVFVGTLYRHLRSPVPALQHFEALGRAHPEQRYELHFYGAVNDCGDVLTEYAARMPGLVTVHGLVSRTRVTEAMAAADAVLNIGNHSTAQLGSKVIEYVAMGRPIINFVSIEDDASLNVLRTHPSCLTLSVGEGPVSQESLTASAAFLSDPPNIPDDYVRRERSPYSPENVTQQYLVRMGKAK
jgi:glycosyltransferase involved in cell wall biosynthesis